MESDPVWDGGSTVKIESVEDEWRHIARLRCPCGGSFQVGTQSHEFDERKGRHDLVDHAPCSNCGRAKELAFDVSGYFAQDGG